MNKININTLNIENTLFKLKNIILDNYILIIGMILILIITTIISRTRAKKKKIQIINDNKKNDELLISQDIENKEQIQNLAFTKLKELKIAKMNNDFETIKKITTNEIYDLYNRQIKTLEENKQKNIVQDIKYLQSYITNINDNIINLRMVIECYDFVIDNKNRTIKGKDNKKVMQTYEIEIINSNDNCIIQKIQLLYEREL